jgi:hypothetical protein
MVFRPRKIFHANVARKTDISDASIQVTQDQRFMYFDCGPDDFTAQLIDIHSLLLCFSIFITAIVI